jgi:hypothetical protein
MQYRTLIEILHCMHECFISIRREIDKIYVFQGYPILEVYTVVHMAFLNVSV